MKISLKALFLILILFGYVSAKCQYQFPFRVDNYAGMQAGIFNPAATLTQKLNWEVDIVSGGFFIENNIAYIQNTNTLSIINNQAIKPASTINSEKPINNGDLIYDFYYNNNKKFLIQNAYVGLPGLLMSVGNNQKVGIFFNTRESFSGTQFPFSLDYYHFDQTPQFVKIPSDKFSISGMAWTEIGGHYAISREHSKGLEGIGINIKYLIGYEGFYFRNEAPTFITQLPNDSFKLDHLQLSYAMTTSNLDAKKQNSLNVNGHGISLDLGYTYTIEGTDGYDWKFEAGLNDIGWISFNRNAEKHYINTSDSFYIAQNKYTDSINIISKTRLLSSDILGNPLASLTGQSFSLGTPARLNFMVDYRLLPHIYLTGLGIFDLPISNKQLKMGNILSLIPRFESKWLSASLPISYYQASEINVGLNIRLAYLSIGSTNLMSLFSNNSRFTGTDFYFAVQLHSISFGDGEYTIKGKKISRKKVRCYEF